MVESQSVENTFKIGRSIGKSIKEGSFVLLYGDLGCGKTVLAKGIAESLGIKRSLISSPTFNIVHEYDNLIHMDLYRLRSLEDIESVGFYDFLNDKRIKLIEWPKLIERELKNLSVISIKCSFLDENRRLLEIHDKSGKICETLRMGGFNVKNS